MQFEINNVLYLNNILKKIIYFFDVILKKVISLFSKTGLISDADDKIGL